MTESITTHRGDGEEVLWAPAQVFTCLYVPLSHYINEMLNLLPPNQSGGVNEAGALD